MTSDRLLALIRCPSCGAHLARDRTDLVCRGCGASFPQLTPAYADLRPSHAFSEQTRYLDDALHADRRQSSVAPPVLSAGVRNDVLREFLDLGPDDAVIDLGCGSGRALIWNADRGAYGVGLDVSPHFAAESCDRVDLVLGDLRRLPLADGSFTKAFALDVAEHLSRDALEAMLAEAARVLAPGGRLFVYSHVRRNARIAIGLRAINRVAAMLDRTGLIDLRQERLRKSDHVNPLADVADLRATVARAGFQIERIRYYTPLVGGFIENILLRLAERAVTLAMRRRTGPDAAVKEARAAGKRVVARRGTVYRTLRVLTAIMKLDLWLFGSIESGPFFALLVKAGPATR
jgi:SAM-dependent methyltransferase